MQAPRVIAVTVVASAEPAPVSAYGGVNHDVRNRNNFLLIVGTALSFLCPVHPEVPLPRSLESPSLPASDETDAPALYCTADMSFKEAAGEFFRNGVRGRRNPLKRLDSRKERAWIFLPLAWIFLPLGLDFPSKVLENISPCSAHAELALQAGRGRRVLEGQLLVGIDIMMRALGGERRLVEA